MSLATRCPACGTTFRVVRDQLRISDGWVRCGRCSHVFDGAAALHDPLSGPVPEAAASPVAPEASAPAAASAGIDFFSDALLRLQADGPPASVPPPPLIAPDALVPAMPEAPPVLAVPAAGPDLEVELLEDEDAHEEAAQAGTAPDSVLDARPGHDAWAQLPSLQMGPGPAAPQASTEPHLAAEVGDASRPSALRQARIASLESARAARARARGDEVAAVVLTASDPGVMPSADEGFGTPSAFGVARQFRASPGAISPSPQRWGGRLLRIAGVAALTMLLLAQVLYQERNAIVARQPSLQPWAAGLCERLGCQLSALRRIADLTIDGASFSRERSGEGYQFSFTLRNRAAVPLAMPAVELSLLDFEERTVVRRVLRPAEYGAPPVLAAHAERMTQLPIVLVGEDPSSASRVAGFRLDAFYP